MESSADRFRGKVAAVLGLLVFLWSCSTVPDTLGEQRMADSTFMQVLLEMHMVEGAMTTVGSYEVNTRRDTLTAKLYAEILARHKTSAADFDQTLLYYQNHPGEFEVIYDSLIAPLADSAAKVRARTPEAKAPAPTPSGAAQPAPSPSAPPNADDSKRKEIQRRMRERNARMKQNKNASGGTGAN